MRILVVERTLPWPQVNGTSMRVANVVRALAQLGEVDFLLLAHWGTPADTSLPATEPLARFKVAPRAPRRGPWRREPARRLAWLAGSRLPFSVGMRDYSSVRSAFLSWARSPYDLAWIGRAHSYVPLAGLIAAPTIVDFDDLEDHKIGSWLGVASDAAGLAGGDRTPFGPGILRSSGAHVFNAVNRRRWRALEHRIAREVDSVVVCSELDRERLDVPNAVVIANGYAQPDRSVGRIDPADPATTVLAGTLEYAPNADAARFLVKDVLPRLRAVVPGARVRLVGRNDRRVAALASIEGVTLTGFVPDMVAELSRADLVAVPIRFGSGTRVKILEAFAHRIPVVATTLGCEGIDVIDGRHLLIADQADAFASACATLLTDPDRRRAVTDAAYDLYRRRYRWDVIRPRVVTLAREIAQKPVGRLAVSR